MPEIFLSFDTEILFTLTQKNISSVFRIRIQLILDRHFRLKTNTRRIEGFDDQKFIKILYFFKIKNCNLLIPWSP
jgi:hypothetical protein